MSGEDRRKLLYLVAFAAVGVVALALVLGFLLTRDNKKAGPGKQVPPTFDLGTLSGIRRTAAPWDAGYDRLPDRVAPLGLNSLGSEGQKLHIHQHLDIYIDGKHIVPPAGIGIYDGEFITELHSHSASAESLPGPAERPTGVIHVESPTKSTYSLGQYFGVWGVYLSKKCIGGYCAKPGKPFRVYVNGKLYKGDPVLLALEERQEIAIVYGKPPKKIPSGFKWNKSL